MSDVTNVSQNNSKSSKPRLGRGLGSLLSGVDTQDTTGRPKMGSDFDSPVPQAKIPAVVEQVPVANSANQPEVQAKVETVVVEKIVEVEKLVEVEKVVEKIVEVEKVVEKIVEKEASPIPETARIWTVSIEKLSPNTQQPRQVFEDTALKELSASIKEKGILQPISARRKSETEFEIIAGERRWRAAQMAGLKEVPVILKEADEQDSLELAILENIQRADLNPVEEAEAYDHLMKTYNLTQVQVADRLGKERPTIANALRLLVLPPEVKLMIGGGELSAGHAKVLLGLESMADQISLAKEVIREKLSVRALEKKVAEKKSQASGSQVVRPGGSMGIDVSAKLVEALAGELQKLIGTRVVIDYADRRGKLSVYFHSDEQLTEIVERMRKGWAKPSAAPTVSSRN